MEPTFQRDPRGQRWWEEVGNSVCLTPKLLTWGQNSKHLLWQGLLSSVSELTSGRKPGQAMELQIGAGLSLFCGVSPWRGRWPGHKGTAGDGRLEDKEGDRQEAFATGAHTHVLHGFSPLGYSSECRVRGPHWWLLRHHHPIQQQDTTRKRHFETVDAQVRLCPSTQPLSDAKWVY